MPRSISITGDDLTIEQFAQVVLNYTPVKLHPSARSKMEQSRALVDMAGTLNRAVHAQSVDSDAADWALTVGPTVLASLDAKVSTVASSNSRT